MSEQAIVDVQPRRIPAPVDRDYWLGHCNGFRVDSSGGRVGFVEEVRGGGDPDATATLAVRAGMRGHRLLLVPSEKVDFVVPRAKRIWLKASPVILASEAAPLRVAASPPPPPPRSDT